MKVLSILGRPFVMLVVLMFMFATYNAMAENKTSTPKATTSLTKAEQANLMEIMNHEKLARDVCKTIYKQWKTCTFHDVLYVKQMDMDRIKDFLVTHKVLCPLKNETGKFPTPNLNQLYLKLTQRANKSLADAIGVCLCIEKTNAKLINRCLCEKCAPETKILLRNLLKDSQSHIKKFSDCLKRIGVAASVHAPCL